MVAPDKYNTIVCLLHSLVVALQEEVVVIALLVESESAVACDNAGSVGHLVLHAELVYQAVEVAMNISTDNEPIAVREIVYLIICVRHDVFFLCDNQEFVTNGVFL